MIVVVINYEVVIIRTGHVESNLVCELYHEVSRDYNRTQNGAVS